MEFQIGDQLIKSNYIREWNQFPFFQALIAFGGKTEPITLDGFEIQTPDELLVFNYKNYIKYKGLYDYLGVDTNLSKFHIWETLKKSIEGNLTTDDINAINFQPSPYVDESEDWIEFMAHLDDSPFRQFFGSHLIKIMLENANYYVNSPTLNSSIKVPFVVYYGDNLSQSFGDIVCENQEAEQPTISPFVQSNIQWRTEDQIIAKLTELTAGFITEEFIDKLPEAFMSGGLISALWSMGDDQLDTYINTYSPDLDIYLVCSDDIDRKEAALEIVRYATDLECSAIHNGKNIIMFAPPKSRVPIQLICSNYNDEWDIFSTFDMTHLQVGLSCDGLVASYPAFYAHLTRTTNYMGVFGIKPYRIMKALNRGFAVVRDETVDFLVEKIFGGDLEQMYLFAEKEHPIKKYDSNDLESYSSLIKAGLMDIYELVATDEITCFANFRNPLFQVDYDIGGSTVQLNWDYEPVIRNNVFIPNKKHCFTFFNGNWTNNKNGYDYFTVSESHFMKVMLSSYVKKIAQHLDNVPIVNFNVDRIPIRELGIIEKMDRRTTIYIRNVSIMDGDAYVHFGVL